MIIRASIDWQPGDATVRASPPSELSYSVSVETETVTIDGEEGTVAVEDQLVTRTVSALGTQRYYISIAPSPGTQLEEVEYTNLTPDVCELNDNVVDRLENGNALIRVKVTAVSGKTDERTIALKFSSVGGAVQVLFVEGVPGTDRATSTDLIRDYLVEGKEKELFKGGDWNPDRWCSHIDLTCVPMTSGKYYGALVTPRHILGCAHATMPVGSAVAFRVGGATVSRTILAKQIHPDYYTVGTIRRDYCIYVLSDDVTGALPATVLPDDWLEHYPTNIQWLPLLACDGEKKALVVRGLGVDGEFVACATPRWEPDSLFAETKVTGDSGSPCFLITEDGPILLTTWTWPDAGSNVFNEKQSLNDLIAEVDSLAGVSTGYTLTEHAF